MENPLQAIMRLGLLDAMLIDAQAWAPECLQHVFERV